MFWEESIAQHRVRVMNGPPPFKEDQSFYSTRRGLEKHHSRLFSGEPTFTVTGCVFFKKIEAMFDFFLQRDRYLKAREACWKRF